MSTSALLLESLPEPSSSHLLSASSLHVDAARMGRIEARVNDLRPDLVVLLGDYAAGHEPAAERTPAEQQEILGGVDIRDVQRSLWRSRGIGQS